MRERPPGRHFCLWKGRITPAHAGKTMDSTFSTSAMRDHPRACGKDLPRLGDSLPIQGSPPRMRERPSGEIVWAGKVRITPAHAGKTPEGLTHRTRDQDHPRACGKDSISRRRPSRSRGSPPRMRERRKLFRRSYRQKGITPAHAGKTFARRRNVQVGRDHPRACGKDVTRKGEYMVKVGSPPRMRERPSLRRFPIARDGITPAHAGKTWP